MLKYKQVLSLPLLVAGLFLSGCATDPGASGHSPQTPQFSGFLDDYSKLKPESGGGDALVWRNTQVNFARYNKILIERIRVSLKDDAANKTIDPTELKALVDYFHEALVRELGSKYPIVDKPGPDVLRVRIAITDLVPTKPELSVVTLVVPYATIADFGSGAASGREAGSPAYVGETGIEAEFIDGGTQQVVAQYVDREIGKKYVVDTSHGLANAVSKGFSQYSKAYSTWGYAKQAFDFWAKLFRERFDALHGTS